MAISSRFKRKKPSKIKMIIFVVIGLLVVVGGLLSIRGYRWFIQPNVFPSDKEYDYLYIPTGASFDDVVQLLTFREWLNDSQSFVAVAKLMGYDKLVKAGRYRIESGMSNYGVVMLLRSGHQTPVQFTFNNLRTVSQLAGIVGNKLEADSASVMKLIGNEAYIDSLGFDERTIISLFIPNTYQFFWNTNAEQWMNRMHREYDKFWNEQRRHKADSIGLTAVEVSVLASIVDEETVKNDEKPLVAGLYLNRLRTGMALQADPTIKFALGDFTIRRILKKDLDIVSPYNTYRNTGLPPGPIRIPSVAGIDAVLNAVSHNYIYMCAKDDFSGYHNFASTYRQHQQNALKYQRALRSAGVFR
jgi:UPF0755 protein